MCASWSGKKDYNRRWMRAHRALRKNTHDDLTSSSESDIEAQVVEDGAEDLCFEPDGEIALDNPIQVNNDDDFSDGEVSADTPISSESENVDPLSSSDSENEHDSDHSGVESHMNVRDELAKWVNDYQVKHNAVDDLLKILQRHGHQDLPATARTLVQTPKTVETDIASGMEYVYLGVSEQVSKAYKTCKANINDADSIHLAMNIDGIPLHKDTSNSLWPILCSITNATPVHVFPVALTYGPSKPENLDFLQDTVRDLGKLLTNGLSVDGKVIEVYLKCIACDAPAKAMVKGTKQYSGYHGCDKCNQKGEWKGRMTYPRMSNLQKRTDDSFRAKQDPEHHKADTPFCELPIDMVKCFPLDYMHQSCLGVMKKLILIWIRGKGRLRNYKLGAVQVQSISEKLVELRDCITSDFQRKPRPLSEIDRWKATELRQFLLYTGKICLKGVLPAVSYSLFMALSVATCILVNRKLSEEYHAFAEDLLIYFNDQGCALYGQEFLVYNVHSMVHLADEAREFGDLNTCAAFPFENYLQYMKKLVRSGKRPIVQIVKRLCEVEQFQSAPTQPKAPVVSTKKPNNCYVLSESSCCEVQEETNETREDDDQLFLCRIYTNSENAFTSPCNSKIIGVYKVSKRNTRMQMVPHRSLKKKALKFKVDRNTFIFLALLHC